MSFTPSEHSPKDSYGVDLGPSFDAGVTTASPSASSVVVPDVTGAKFIITKDAVVIEDNMRSYPHLSETGSMMLKNLLDVKGNDAKIRSVIGSTLDQALAKVTAMTSAQQTAIVKAEPSVAAPQSIFKKPLFWVGVIGGVTVIAGTAMYFMRQEVEYAVPT